VFTLPAVPLLLRRRGDPIHLRMALCTEDTRPATTKREGVRALGSGRAHPWMQPADHVTRYTFAEVRDALRSH
jgi:hypothetical protein